MNKITTSLLVVFFVAPAAGDSLLNAQEFPKTFDDLSFNVKFDFLRDSYMPFEVQYDANGVCVSGCAYQGITIKDDMEAVEEATEEMAELIEKAEEVEEKEKNKEKPKEKPVDFPEEKKNPKKQEVPEKPTVFTSQNWCQNGLSTKLPLRYPVDMTSFKHLITSDFGFRKIKKGSSFHPALDIGVPEGTPVYATADGFVEFSGFDANGGGNYISIKHDNGLITQYMHLSKSLVKTGQHVSACDKIAESGNTGTSTGPHLDYRIRFQSNKNKYVDILCPRKAGDRKAKKSVNADANINDNGHSLFNAPYKFKNSSAKHSQWRVEHGHCMKTINDLLPDEAR